MNSRERYLAAIDLKPVDRLPLDFTGVEEVIARLKAHFKVDDIFGALKLDCPGHIGPEYIGPAMPALPKGESENFWGMRYRMTGNDSGAYNEQVVFPLAGAKTIDDLKKFRWPDARWFDCSKMAAQARIIRETRAVKCGYMCSFYMHNQVRGLEQSLIDPLEDPEFTHELLNRISDFMLSYHRRMFEACPGLIDLCEVTDDLGSQTGPMMSLSMFREFYASHLKKYINLCQEFNIKVMHHDCGSCRIFLPDLVEMGINMLDPIQWTCPGMDMKELKAEFGKKICFHGAVENQKILPFGTPEDVRAEVRHCIDSLAPDKTGYILTACHALQSNTSVENIIAMYDEARKYGDWSKR